MDLKQQIYRHRKDLRVIFGGLGTLSGGVRRRVLPAAASVRRGMSSELAASKLLLFVLWYINIILILAILFVLVRNIFNLVLERQSRILGSKFKTKLVAASVLLSLLPVLIIFPMAAQILFESFEQWFALPIEDVVEQADETVATSPRRSSATTRARAPRARRGVGLDLVDLDQRPELQRIIQTLREELEVHYLAIFDGTDHIHGTVDPSEGLGREPDFRGLQALSSRRPWTRAWRCASSTRVLGIDGRLLVAAAARRRPPVDPTPEEGETGPRQPGAR